MQLLFLDSIRQSVSKLQEYNYQPKTLLVFHNQDRSKTDAELFKDRFKTNLQALTVTTPSQNKSQLPSERIYRLF